MALDYGPLAKITRYASWDEFLKESSARPGRLALLTTQGDQTLARFAFEANDTLLMGAESAGAPPRVHAAASARLRIPLAPGVRSLNLVTAAALALGEALRQTGGYAVG